MRHLAILLLGSEVIASVVNAIDDSVVIALVVNTIDDVACTDYCAPQE